MTAKSPAQLTEPVIRLLRQPNYATVATLNPDGSAHQTVVWVDTDGENVLFNTAEGRAKPRNLRRNPAVSVLVVQGEDWYRWASIRGEVAEITTQGADRHIDELAQKYLGKERYPWHRPEQPRLKVVIRPLEVISYGLE